MAKIPQLVKIRQKLPRPRIENLSLCLREELAKLRLEERIKPGDNIAITAGSRGINGITEILSLVVARLKELGARPRLISAMGTHGGGTPEGQRQILDSLGITDEAMGCPVICSSEVVKLGITANYNIDVYCAREAVEADGLLIINRIKSHTAFRAPRESGLLKMMGIGLGRAPGAAAIHSLGQEYIGPVILEMARVVMREVKVLGGIAILENGYEDTEGLYGLLPQEIEEQEAVLLKRANELMPSLPVEDLDLLVVEEMGKNFSGTGMDTNIIGRWRISGVPEPENPRIKRIVVLDLSEPSHGNANGVGLADFITRKMYEKIDFKSTYLNCLTTGFLQRVMIPLIMDNEEEAITTALESLKLSDSSQARIVRIKNTLHLDELWVSPNIARELADSAKIEIIC